MSELDSMMDDVSSQTTKKRLERALPFERVALVLQGGGALGAYQAGVYQAIHEANIDVNWISGTSIGAINGAPSSAILRNVGWNGCSNSGKQSPHRRPLFRRCSGSRIFGETRTIKRALGPIR